REPDAEAWARLAADECAGQVLDAATAALTGLEPFDAEAVEGALRGICEALEMKPRQAFQPIRIAIAGSTVAAGLYESIAFLGRDESLRRLARARAAAG
ncbi:MAG: hypothetical protein RL190_1660, partial [Actinomycetota bacterium]